MVPINFEEQIKEKFEARKIQPSAQAWEKISDQLDNSQAKKKTGFVWYAIAASVIGLLIMMMFFNTKNDVILDKNSIVNTPENKINKDSNQLQEKGIEVFKNKETIATTKINESKNAKKIKSSTLQNNLSIDKNEEDLVVTNDEIIKPKLQQENKVNSAIDLLINEKINAIAAQVDSLTLNNNAVTDAEIDALLRKAQDEILKQKIFKSSNRVDAMALLNEAESELDLSMRDQLFETLKNGYLKVRTALADRNK